MKKIAFVYTSMGGLVETTRKLAAERLPGVETVHIADSGLVGDIIRAGEITPAVRRRLMCQFESAAAAGADAIVCACSSVGAITEMAERVGKRGKRHRPHHGLHPSRRLTRMLIEEDLGPVYMSVSRNATEDLYAPDTSFEPGKAKVLREGRDASILAYGLSVGRALKAAQALAQEGISCRVVDMFTLKPADEAAIVAAALETGAVITAEEQWIPGGLYSIVAETLLSRGISARFGGVGITRYTSSGTYAQLVEHYGISEKDIAQKVRNTLGKA